jgi:hypothetical protein
LKARTAATTSLAGGLPPVQGVPLTQAALATAQPVGSFFPGWRIWALGAVTLAALAGLFFGRRS